MSGYKARPVREVVAGVYQCSVAWPRYTLESYLIDRPEGAIAIDPQDISPRSLASARGNRIAHIILTNHYHERAAAILRARWDAQVWAPAADVRELEAVVPDHAYSEDTALPGNLRAVALGGITPGEHALLWPEERGVLFVGDALGTVSYWTHGESRLGAHPRMRPPRSLGRLLDLNFTSLAVGHGDPVLDTAKAELAEYLERAEQ